jgi:hypothetical protein
MMNTQALCGCAVCIGNCERNIRRQRTEMIAWQCQNVNKEDRPSAKKLLWQYIEIVDCMIIIKQLKIIDRHGTEYP